ncbi:MAG: pentapeptide repeat-containing protein [Rhizomicrobium sp.]
MTLKNLYEAKGAALQQAEINGIFSSQGRYAICRGGQFTRLKGANLDGLNLANRNLKEVDFSATSLVKAILCGSNLARASLYCADLRGCDLRNANLTGADMRGASFKDANLSFAVLDGADLRAGMMMYVASDGNASIMDRGDLSKDATGPAGRVDFSNCSMKSAQFGNAKLDNAKFDGALLDGASFRGARLRNASFRGAVLMGVNLNDLGVPPEALKDCVLDVSPQALAKSADLKAKLDAHHTWISSNGKQGASAVLDGEDLRPLQKEFSGRCLIGLSARNASAIGVSFAGCQLQGAKFDGADLRDADFSKADLSGASLKGTRLAHAKFEKARLHNLLLVSGALVRPDLTEAEATQEQFLGAISDEKLSVLGLPTKV